MFSMKRRFVVCSVLTVAIVLVITVSIRQTMVFEYHLDSDGEVYFSLPFPDVTLPIAELLEQQWVDNLWMILSEIFPESPPVHIIAGNYEYCEG